MPKKEGPALPGRAWHLLRLALALARKGSAVKRRLVANLHVVVSHLKALRTNHRHSYSLHYGEHELSFGDTPIFRFNRHRRSFFPFACIDDPLVAFEDDDDDNESTLIQITDGDGNDDDDDDEGREGEKGIDSKAEEFISKFYEEMKLQRELSCLRYNEMLYRGMS